MMIINKVFITVFLLSVVGTVVGITFLALQSVLYKYTSAEFMVKVNRVVILTFVIPVFYALGMLDHTNYHLSEYNMLVLVEQGTLADKLYTFRDTVGFADKIALLWLAGLGLFLLFYAVSNVVFTHRIRESSEEIVSGPWRKQFHTLCQSNGFPEEQIRLLSSTGIKQICTVGLINKKIIIPEQLLDMLNETESGIILRHELTHIRKNDVPMKLGMFILCSLNWFNPLVYFLNENLNEWVELSCDEEMLAFADSAYRHAYIDALMKIMEEQQTQRGKQKRCEPAVYFNDGRKIRSIKRRLKGIMKKRNVKKTAQVLAFSGILCTMACGTALAGDLEYPINSVLSNHLTIWDEDMLADDDFIQDSDGYDFISFSDAALEHAVAPNPGTQFELVFEDGTRESYTGNAAVDRDLHKCSMEKTNVKKHEVKKDGSCILTTYAAGKCTICGRLVIGDEISTTTYKVCPH